MKAGSSSFDLIFGQDGVGYALRFTDKTSVEFITPEGSREIAVGKNFVEAALAGKKVTLRLELASDKAMLYGMIEDESEETLETALCTLEGIRLVGSIGVTVPEGSRITIDDVQFVNMAASIIRIRILPSPPIPVKIPAKTRAKNQATKIRRKRDAQVRQ